jgi:hypothetical protein
VTAWEVCVGSALLLWTALAGAQDVSGFAEVRGTWSAGVEGKPWHLLERFRPTFEAELGDRWLVAATAEAHLDQGRRMQAEVQRVVERDLSELLDEVSCTWPEEENEALAISDASDVFALERLYVDSYQPGFDLRVGRQAVQWGSALFFNPTDPYPQVLFTEPWRIRSGVNAARLSVPIGGLHQVLALVGTDDLFKRLRLAARGTVNAAQTDWSLVTAYRSEADELLAGVDIKGTLGVGWWAEAALHAPEVFDNKAQAAAYEELAVGVDYSFPVLDLLLVSAQYYRYGGPTGGGGGFDPSAVELPSCSLPADKVVLLETLGQEVPEDPFADALGDDQAGSDPFAPFVSGRDYALLSVNAQFTSVLGAGLTGLANVQDGTGVTIGTLTVRPTGALEVAASAQVPMRLGGGPGEFSPSDKSLVTEIPPLIEGLGDPASIDFSGMVPAATLSLWTRLAF